MTYRRLILWMAVSLFSLASSLVAKGEVVLVTYTAGVFTLDFDGDGIQDQCTVSCKKVKDTSYNPTTKTESSEKFNWYQFEIGVQSGLDQKALLEDEFSVKEDDFKGLFEHFGKKPLTAQSYLISFFDYSKCANEIQTRVITKDDIDREWIEHLIKVLKAKTTVDKVIKEIKTGRHAVLAYRGSWAEDLRQVVYSKELGSAMGLKSPYSGD